MPDQQHVSADLPSDDQLRALEEEKGAIIREYEAKIADLQAQFSKEQCDKAALQEEFAKLQQARDAQLAEAQVNNVQCGIICSNDCYQCCRIRIGLVEQISLRYSIVQLHAVFQPTIPLPFPAWPHSTQSGEK